MKFNYQTVTKSIHERPTRFQSFSIFAFISWFTYNAYSLTRYSAYILLYRIYSKISFEFGSLFLSASCFFSSSKVHPNTSLISLKWSISFYWSSVKFFISFNWIKIFCSLIWCSFNISCCFLISSSVGFLNKLSFFTHSSSSTTYYFSFSGYFFKFLIWDKSLYILTETWTGFPVLGSMNFETYFYLA